VEKELAVKPAPPVHQALKGARNDTLAPFLQTEQVHSK